MQAAPAPLGRRESAKQETRRILLQAGLAEFAEHGLAEPSLDAICARAGFTRGAFYVHFRDREHFIAEVMDLVIGSFLDAVIASGGASGDLEETIRRFGERLRAPDLLNAQASSELVPENLRLQRLLEACARSEPVRERLAGLLGGAMQRVARAAEAGQRSGAIAHAAGSEAIGSLLVCLALGAVVARELGVVFDPTGAQDALVALLKAR